VPESATCKWYSRAGWNETCNRMSHTGNSMAANSEHTAASVYSRRFFDYLNATSTPSARAIVPLVMELLHPSSVVDVGCGRGAWLRVFQELGVRSIRGLDGTYVELGSLLIPEPCFTPIDLSGDFRIPGKYDLAISLEVAEHLPPTNAGHLVSELVNCAPLVLFSAAIPGQGGVHHINERFPSYWHRLFAAHGYAVMDPIRPRIRHDRSVDFWYRQNLVLYASSEAIASSPRLTEEQRLAGGGELEWVHASIAYRRSVSATWKELRRELLFSMRRRTSALLGRPEPKRDS
jgi:hypothetical protein